MTRIDRSVAARLGEQTMEILESESYEGPAGHVALHDCIASAVVDTINYPANSKADSLANVAGGRGPTRTFATRVEVVNETTLDATRRLSSSSMPAALNFASAYHPGGGFLGGARAQEESLARSSALYSCLRDQPMYAYHEANRSPMYSDWVVHSPNVPVFRTDPGDLLGVPYRCAFITSPAVNAKVVLKRDPTRVAEIEAAMRTRIDKVLAVASRHEHATLVLGAWGCGAFGNDPQVIARLFATALQGRFRGHFAHVVFAIVDWTSDDRTIGPFRRALLA